MRACALTPQLTTHLLLSELLKLSVCYYNRLLTSRKESLRKTLNSI